MSIAYSMFARYTFYSSSTLWSESILYLNVFKLYAIHILSYLNILVCIAGIIAQHWGGLSVIPSDPFQSSLLLLISREWGFTWMFCSMAWDGHDTMCRDANKIMMVLNMFTIFHDEQRAHDPDDGYYERDDEVHRTGWLCGSVVGVSDGCYIRVD